MVGVMAMTPVYIRAGSTDHGDTLRIVGFVLSLHIAGMYAFSPVTGWLTDRWGRRPVILTGVALLLGACAVAGTAGARHAPAVAGPGAARAGLVGDDGGRLDPGHGVGRRSANRPSVQGLSDLVMGLAGGVLGRAERARGGLVLVSGR